MKPSNKILILGVWLGSMAFLSSCGKHERGAWTRFQAQQTILKTRTERTPAQVSSAAPRCFTDRYQKSLLQGEINEMIQVRDDGKLGSYTHGGIFFSELPLSTIDALKVNYRINAVDPKRTWTLVDPRQGLCKDYSCMVDALYTKADMQGTTAYWFFLKTGYLFSMTDAYTWNETGAEELKTIPGYSAESYFFDSEEMKAFWLMTNLLPPEMLNMQSLNIIQRIPRGYFPSVWIRDGGRVVAHARGSWANGVVLFSDPALRYGINPFDSTGYFYNTTTHEFAHRLANVGSTLRNGKSGLDYDMDPEFLALSGWQWSTLTKPDGSVSAKWTSDPEAEFTTGYARTSPSEDFAEAISFYRTYPFHSSSVAVKKYEYVKHHFFNHLGYTKADLTARYTRLAKEGVLEAMDQWVSPCIEGKTVPALTKPLMLLAKKLEVSLPFDPKLKACVQVQATRQIGEELARIRYNEPEACNTLKDADATMYASVIQELQVELNEYFKNHDRLTELLGGIKDFRAAVVKEFDGRALILSCSQDADSEKCYNTKLNAEFDRLQQKYKVLLSVAKTDISDIEKKRFLTQNDFGKMTDSVNRFYGSFFAQYSSEINIRVDQMWQTCLAVPARANTGVLLEPYQPGIYYVSPAVMQCLNENIPVQLSELRSHAGADQGVDIFSAEAKTWITQRILMPQFKALLDQRVSAASRAETETLNAAKSGLSEQIVLAMMADQDWRVTLPYLKDECVTKASEGVSAKVHPRDYKFTDIEKEIAELTVLTCEKVSAEVVAHPDKPQAATPTATPTAAASVFQRAQPVTTAQKQLLTPVWEQLKPLFVNQFDSRFETCRARIYFTAGLRSKCIYFKWDEMKLKAIREWTEIPAVKAVMFDESWTQAQIERIASQRIEDEDQNFDATIMKRFYQN